MMACHESAGERALPRDVFVVTRPGEPGRALVAALTGLGEQALWVPAFAIGAAPDPAALAATLARLAEYQLAVFVSPNAVRAVAAALQRPWPASVAIAAVGAATLHAVRSEVPGAAAATLIAPAEDSLPSASPNRMATPSERAVGRAATGGAADTGRSTPRVGLQADGGEPRAGSEALWATLRLRDWRGARALILRAAHGRDWLGERLRAGGAQVDELATYDRLAVAPNGATVTALRGAFGVGDARCVLVLSSSEAVAALAPLWQAAGLTGWVLSGLAVALHPRIAATLRAAGHRTVQVVELDAGALQAVARATRGGAAAGQ